MNTDAHRYDGPHAQPTFAIIGCAMAVVDAKVIERITDVERGQVMNHLRITGLKVGVLLDFRRPRPEWERIIL